MNDDPTPDGQAIADFWHWTHWLSGLLTSPSGLHYDDVVQEGLIEAWRILRCKGGRDNVSATYLTRAMRDRMINIVNGRPAYGGNRRPGPRTEPPHLVALDDTDHPGVLDEVEIAYHHGEIVQAINDLAPADREYVWLRFWCGLTDAEIARRRDTSNQYVWQRWNRQIKPRLQESLNHLVDYG